MRSAYSLASSFNRQSRYSSGTRRRGRSTRLPDNCPYEPPSKDWRHEDLKNTVWFLTIMTFVGIICYATS